MGVLVSDWKSIGTAGDTIDGRLIEERDLIDAAETYDKDEYTAVINSDHELSTYGNFGHVEKVRLGKDKKGRTVLQAKLAPNFRLIEKNRNGQGMFTSMELLPNFANTGKTYLTGLAVTDMPASVGTSMLRMFSSQKDKAENPKVMKEFLSLTFDELENPNEKSEPEEKLLAKFARLFIKTLPTTDEDNDMSNEQLETLCQQNERIAQSLSAIQKSLAAAAPEAPAAESSAKSAPEPSSQDDSELVKLTATVETLNETVSTLSAAFKQLLEERPGTEPAGNEGSVSSKEFV